MKCWDIFVSTPTGIILAIPHQITEIKYNFDFDRFLNDFGKDENFPMFYEKLLSLVKEVSSWSSCVAEMPAIIFSDGSLNNNSFVGALFHLFFDIQWSLIEMAYMAINLQKYNQCNRTFRDSFSEVLLYLQENLCSDLIYLGFRKFSDVSLKFFSFSFRFHNVLFYLNS